MAAAFQPHIWLRSGTAWGANITNPSPRLIEFTRIYVYYPHQLRKLGSGPGKPKTYLTGYCFPRVFPFPALLTAHLARDKVMTAQFFTYDDPVFASIGPHL